MSGYYFECGRCLRIYALSAAEDLLQEHGRACKYCYEEGCKACLPDEVCKDCHDDFYRDPCDD